MKYEEIIKSIAEHEKTSVNNIEKEIKKALVYAGFDCSPKDFIICTSKNLLKTIYSKQYNLQSIHS